MTNQFTKQQRSFRFWQRAGTGSERTTSTVAREMGRTGAQLRMWATGNRDSLPLEAVTDLALATGIRFELLLTSDQRRTVRKIARIHEKEAQSGKA